MTRPIGTFGTNDVVLGGIKPWAHHAHYGASKAGVIHMTRCLAKAFGPNRITVNSVAPGVIEFGGAPDERVARPEILTGTLAHRSSAPTVAQGALRPD